MTLQVHNSKHINPHTLLAHTHLNGTGSHNRAKIGPVAFIMSYDTIIGIDFEIHFYRTKARYSKTTSKHITRTPSIYGPIYLDEEEFDKKVRQAFYALGLWFIKGPPMMKWENIHFINEDY